MAAKRGTSQTQSTTAQKQLDAKLLAYCAMAGGALLAAPPAEAAVVYSGLKNISVSGNTTLTLDLDNNGMNDFQFRAVNQGGGYYFSQLEYNISLVPGIDNSFAGFTYQNNCNLVNVLAVTKLDAGASIASSQLWKHNDGFLNGFLRCMPAFPWGPFNKTTGYMGIKFNIGSRQHYGWIQYHGAITSYQYPLIGAASGTIIDWAFESTPDYSIQAGQTTGSGNPPVDTDTDGDGTPDASDNCPTMYNKWQRDTDHDGTGDACDTTPGCGEAGQPYCEYFDTDADGVQNRLDNCPTVSNPRQLDADGDGAGDACDTTPGCGTGCGQTACEAVADTDHDYVIDVQDTCPAVFNPYQLDADSDGTGDCCDAEPGCGGGGQPECDTECTHP